MRISGLLTTMLLAATALSAAADAPRARFISHRGESMAYPENTLAAFRAAVERGADGFELDVYLTKDNELICLHDGTAKRTAGADLKPRDATLAELRALDAGAWKGPQFKGERIPTLAEALALARDGFEIYVEIKCGSEIVPFLVPVFAAEPKATPERVLFICFNADVVAAVRRQFPAYRAYWLSGTGPKKDGTAGPTAAEIIAKAKACDASGVDLQDSADITPAFVKTVKDAGLSFHIWTVNHAPRARELAAMGVETVTSDSGASLKNVLSGKPPDVRPLLHWTFDDGGVVQPPPAAGLRTGAVASGGGTTEGRSGKGLLLDGATFKAAPLMLPERGTAALWFKPEAFYDFNTVFDNDAHPDLWELWINKTGELKFRLAGKSTVAHALAAPGEWVHMAVTWDAIDARAVRLYINGEEKAASEGFSWAAPGGTFFIGGGNPGNKKGKGVVDDVRVYGVPLSAEQVKRVMNGK